MASGHAVEITIKLTNKDDRNLEDIVYVMEGAKINNVTDKDDFGKFEISPGKTAVKFTGGNIPKNVEKTIKIDTDVTPTKVIHGDESFVNKDKRSSSNDANIFSTAVFGGSSGTTFAGVSIPANEYGYFYQFSRNSLYSQSPDQVRIDIGSIAPTSFGVINNTWPVSILIDDLPNITVFDGSVTHNLSDDMIPVNLSGLGGVLPTSWSYLGNQMVATYSSLFSTGDTSSVLWFTDLLPPELGGPLGFSENNFLVFSDNGSLLQVARGVLAPSPVPEPSTLLLFGIGAVVLLSYAYRHQKRAV